MWGKKRCVAYKIFSLETSSERGYFQDISIDKKTILSNLIITKLAVKMWNAFKCFKRESNGEISGTRERNFRLHSSRNYLSGYVTIHSSRRYGSTKLMNRYFRYPYHMSVSQNANWLNRSFRDEKSLAFQTFWVYSVLVLFAFFAKWKHGMIFEEYMTNPRIKKKN